MKMDIFVIEVHRRRGSAAGPGLQDTGTLTLNHRTMAGEEQEGRPMTEGNSEETTAKCTQGQGEALSGLDRIRETARRDKGTRFNNLMHHVTEDLLRNAYVILNRKATPGIDEVTWRQYGENLGENLLNLYQRVQFDFLGFTHSCSKNRQGRFTIRRKTIGKRLQRKIKELRREQKKRRHEPVPEQGKWLRSVVQGHFNYHGVPGNRQSIDAFRTEVIKGWFHALKRRSQTSNLTWDRIKLLVETWLPTANLVRDIKGFNNN